MQCSCSPTAWTKACARLVADILEVHSTFSRPVGGGTEIAGDNVESIGAVRTGRGLNISDNKLGSERILGSRQQLQSTVMLCLMTLTSVLGKLC